MKMLNKRFLLPRLICFIIGIFTTTINYGQCAELIFNDEFTGSTVDETKWNFDIGDGCDQGLCGWGNAEEQYFRKENTTVSNGNLVITTKNEAFGGKSFTSSKLLTSGKFNSRFGRYEARIKLPSAGGIWPAFWMLPENGSWPYTGEIDIMEAQHKNPTKIGGTVHYFNGGHTFNGREYEAGVDLSQGFHEYAIEWEPDVIRWYVDDVLYHSVTRANTVDPWPFDKGDWYIILNVSVGGLGTPYTGNIPPTPADYPTQMFVDYVRVYNGTFNIQITGDQKVYENDKSKIYTITPTEGASYNWTVPSGASIVSGQGTPEITVDWGISGGKINVVVTTPDCGTSDYEIDVTVDQPRTTEFTFDDFEANRNLTYLETTDGSLNQSVSNPEPNVINSSSISASYTRATGAQYDGLYMNSTDIGNALEYVSGEKTIWIDVYSDAPVGTEFVLQIEDGNRSSGDWPAGRHSRYSAKTTTQNNWETLEFELLDRPDSSVGAFDVDQLVLLIDPNTYTGHNVYIDNIRKMDAPDPNIIEEVIIADYDGINRLNHFFENGEYTANVPNPSPDDTNNSANVAQYVRGSFELYDVVSFETDAITDSSPFINGDQIFYIDVYTSAPAGTEISLSLENQTGSDNDFPSGRNSQYSGVVKEENAWHTIAFSYATSPDAGTSNLSVNEISILFNPNSNTTDTFYFDNFRYGVINLPSTYTFLETIQDYDEVNHLNVNGTTTGAYTSNTSNPSPNTVNSSSLTGTYARDNSELYDVLFFDTDRIQDASAFAEEEKRFAMDVYTTAPVGTIVSWQLEASSLSTSENYPTGRHSIYQAAITEQSQWHTLEFILTATPDLIVTNEQVDNIVLLFDPGQESGETFYIDNLRVLSKEDSQQSPFLKSITITSAKDEIFINENLQFTAQAYDQNGDPFETNYEWNASGGVIDEQGMFKASEPGTYTITVNSGSVSSTASIIVKGSNSSQITLPGLLEAEDYKDGGQNVGYYDISSGNTGGAYRTDDVDIEDTGDSTGDYNVGWISAGEWLAYDINANSSTENYEINFRVASPNGNGKFHLELNDDPITETIEVPNTGGWQNYNTITVPNITIPNGSQELKIVFDSSGLNLNFLEINEMIEDNITCSGISANGDYSYELSDIDGQTAITFLPERSGIGADLCILYYSTSSSQTYPGYTVNPNVPYILDVRDGENLSFYYTYSLPSGGENNTSNNKHQLIIGDCNLKQQPKSEFELSRASIYPNPVKEQLKVFNLNRSKSIRMYDIKGRLIYNDVININEKSYEKDLNELPKGMYILKIQNDQNEIQIHKIIKD